MSGRPIKRTLRGTQLVSKEVVDHTFGVGNGIDGHWCSSLRRRSIRVPRTWDARDAAV